MKSAFQTLYFSVLSTLTLIMNSDNLEMRKRKMGQESRFIFVFGKVLWSSNTWCLTIRVYLLSINKLHELTFIYRTLFVWKQGCTEKLPSLCKQTIIYLLKRGVKKREGRVHTVVFFLFTLFFNASLTSWPEITMYVDQAGLDAIEINLPLPLIK